MSVRPRSTVGILLALLILSRFDGRLWSQAEKLKPPPSSLEPPVPPSVAGKGSADSLRSPEGIVAIVNDDVITMAELDKRAIHQRPEILERYPAQVVEFQRSVLNWQILDEMVNNKLILQLVEREEQKSEGQKFVAEAEVDAEIDRQMAAERERNQAIGSRDDFYRLIQERNGLTEAEYRTFLSERMKVQRYLIMHVLRSAEIYVSPQEVRQYYLNHLEEFTIPSEIAFRQLRINMGKRDGPQRIEAVEKGLKEGRAFVELARDYSQEAVEGDPESAGRLWRKSYDELKSWYRPIPEEIRKLKKGEISKAIFTVRDTVYYFLIEDIIGSEPKSFVEVQEDIRRKLERTRQSKAVDTFLKRLREKSRVIIYLKQPQGLAQEGRKKAGESAKEGSAGPGKEEPGKEEPGKEEPGKEEPGKDSRKE